MNRFAQTVLCPLCWQRPGKACTITGPDGDHLARWSAAERVGAVTRADLVAAVGRLEVIADHVIVPAGAR